MLPVMEVESWDEKCKPNEDGPNNLNSKKVKLPSAPHYLGPNN